jgi:glycosyltransferase involved in cell wall biosynthesis
VKKVLFFRRFARPGGGHMKVRDYFDHVRSSPEFDPYVWFASDSVMDETNPWWGVERGVVHDFRLADADILFVEGVDWHRLPAMKRLAYPLPVINLIQGVRHAAHDDPLPRYRFLHQALSFKAIRICVSPEVAGAIEATGRVRGPIFTIPNGIDVEAVRAIGRSRERDIDLLVVANKQADRGNDIARQLERPGRRVHLHDRPVARADFLQLIGRSRVATFVPTPAEGFYLPALEAMALGTVVVCPDVIGNRSFCIDGENCLRPRNSEEEIVRATESALHDPDASRELVRRAEDTVGWHDLTVERHSFLEILTDAERLWRTF